MPVPRSLSSLLATGALALGLAACGGDDDVDPLPLPPPPGPAEVQPEVESGALFAAGVPIADLLENATGCAGATVRTSGTVTQVLGPREVVLAGDETRAEGGDGLRVLLAAELPDQAGQTGDPELAEGDAITVTGVFQLLELLPTARDDGKADFRGVPTLVATDIMAGGGEVGQTASTGEGTPCAAGLVAGRTPDEALAVGFGDRLVVNGVGPGAPVADIIENPSSCLGRVVATSGQITSIIGPRTVVLAGDETRAEGGAGIAVLLAVRLPDVAGAGEDPALSVGDEIAVRGPLRVLDRIDDGAEAQAPDFRGIPYLVAYEIERGGTEVQQGADTGEGGGCERFREIELVEIQVGEEDGFEDEEALEGDALDDEGAPLEGDALDEEPLP